MKEQKPVSLIQLVLLTSDDERLGCMFSFNEKPASGQLSVYGRKSHKNVCVKDSFGISDPFVLTLLSTRKIRRCDY
jgi:hypothetical protein